MSEDSAERGCRALTIDGGYRTGDLAAVRAALGDPAEFPNCPHPAELGVGGRPLEYAIHWSPPFAIEALLALGADPDVGDDAGFPPLHAVLSSGRPDDLRIIAPLLARGAAPDQRGLNDWTPLHHAVSLRDLGAIGVMLEWGACPSLATRIDDRATPIEDAEAIGFETTVAAMRRRSK